MSNFAVNASESTIKRGKDLLEKLRQPEEKQGDTLDRIFQIVENQLDGETLEENGVDVKSLDASLTNIRNAFLSAVSGKAELLTQKDAEIESIKTMKDNLERDLRKQIADAKTAQNDAETAAASAQKEAAQALKDAATAKEQSETQKQLLAEKDKTISSLSAQLSAYKDKADSYDTLQQQELEDQQKIKDLTIQIDRITSDAKKDSDLAIAKAVSKKESEWMQQIRELDHQNSFLQAKVEFLESTKKEP